MVGNCLKKIREQKSIGVNELSRLSGVNASYISAIENGRRTNISTDIIKKLATALNIDQSDLLQDGIKSVRPWEDDDYCEKNNILNKTEKNLISKYRSLDDKGKHTVDTVLQMEYNRCNPSLEGKEEIRLAAAHNDNTSPEQLELMKKDLDDL